MYVSLKGTCTKPTQSMLPSLQAPHLKFSLKNRFDLLASTKKTKTTLQFSSHLKKEDRKKYTCMNTYTHTQSCSKQEVYKINKSKVYIFKWGWFNYLLIGKKSRSAYADLKWSLKDRKYKCKLMEKDNMKI